MAESPYNRPVAANLIGEAIDKHRKDMEAGYVGFTLSMFIYEVLRRAQYLTESAQELSET